jgi:hypothetical protein
MFYITLTLILRLTLIVFKLIETDMMCEYMTDPKISFFLNS